MNTVVDTRIIVSSCFLHKWLMKVRSTLPLPEEDEVQTMEFKVEHGHLLLNNLVCGCIESKSKYWTVDVSVDHVDRLIKVLRYVPDQPITVSVSYDKWIDIRFQL